MDRRPVTLVATYLTVVIVLATIVAALSGQESAWTLAATGAGALAAFLAKD